MSSFLKIKNIFLILGIIFLSDKVWADSSQGKFKIIGQTVYKHLYPIDGVKLKTGDVLFYSFERYIPLPGGGFRSANTGETENEYKFVEIYRAKTHKIEAAAKPMYYHSQSQAVELPNGKVLFAGAYCSISDRMPERNTPDVLQLCDDSAHIELYDPSTNTFSVGPAMLIPRTQMAMALMQDGRVLVADGSPELKISPLKNLVNLTAQAEVYDPKTNQFLLTSKMNPEVKDLDSTGITLDTGKVLILRNSWQPNLIYDPKKEIFYPIENYKEYRTNPVVKKLLDGRVLILGGLGHKRESLTSVEIFDPQTEKFRLISNMIVARGDSTDFDATVLKDGRVFIAGGFLDVKEPWWNEHFESLDSTEIFDPKKEAFYPSGKMKKARTAEKLFTLDNGEVLIVGSRLRNTSLREIEIFSPKKEN